MFLQRFGKMDSTHHFLFQQRLGKVHSSLHFRQPLFWAPRSPSRDAYAYASGDTDTASASRDTHAGVGRLGKRA